MPKNYKCILYKNGEQLFSFPFENKSKEENILLFDLFGYETTIDLVQERFIRENEEDFFLLDIKNKSCKIELKKEGYSLLVGVEECNLSVLNSKIVLEYFIETDEARNKIVIERNDAFHE